MLYQTSNSPNTPAKRIALIQQQRRLGVYVRGSADRRPNRAPHHVHMSFEKAADNALLPPRFSGREFSIFIKTRHLRARAGTARRSVVRLSRTKHEIAAVGVGPVRRAEQL